MLLADLFVRLRGTLTGIHPGTQVAPEWVKQQLQSEPLWRLYWALFVCRMPQMCGMASAAALVGQSHQSPGDGFTDAGILTPFAPEPTLRPSQITRLLEKADLGAIALFSLHLWKNHYCQNGCTIIKMRERLYAPKLVVQSCVQRDSAVSNLCADT